jgi:hypothetical protein
MVDKQNTEEFKLSGDEVIAKVREIIKEGNARRIILKNEQGTTLIEVPLTVGVVGAALLPVWAAIGAIAAVAARLTLVVEKRESAPDMDDGDTAA